MTLPRVAYIIVLVCCCLHAKAQFAYTVQPILVNGVPAEGRCLGASGQVGGAADNGQRNIAFRWNAGQVTLLAGFDPNGASASAFAGAMNSANVIVGGAGSANGSTQLASYWDSSYHNVGSLGGVSDGHAINDNGWICGNYFLTSGGSKGFLYRNGQL